MWSYARAHPGLRLALTVAPFVLAAAAFVAFDREHPVRAVISLIIGAALIVTAEASFNPPRAAYLLAPGLVGLGIVIGALSTRGTAPWTIAFATIMIGLGSAVVIAAARLHYNPDADAPPAHDSGAERP